HFHCHRALLFARCDFFKQLFRSGLRDSGLEEVELHETVPEAFRVVRHYIYTDQLPEDVKSFLEEDVKDSMDVMEADVNMPAGIKMKGRKGVGVVNRELAMAMLAQLMAAVELSDRLLMQEACSVLQKAVLGVVRKEVLAKREDDMEHVAEPLSLQYVQHQQKEEEVFGRVLLWAHRRGFAELVHDLKTAYLECLRQMYDTTTPEGNPGCINDPSSTSSCVDGSIGIRRMHGLGNGDMGAGTAALLATEAPDLLHQLHVGVLQLRAALQRKRDVRWQRQQPQHCVSATATESAEAVSSLPPSLRMRLQLQQKLRELL
ncbi:hypothetical protein Agub_g7792, partial [Astrephomene gubernaculifera]